MWSIIIDILLFIVECLIIALCVEKHLKIQEKDWQYQGVGLHIEAIILLVQGFAHLIIGALMHFKLRQRFPEFLKKQGQQVAIAATMITLSTVASSIFNFAMAAQDSSFAVYYKKHEAPLYFLNQLLFELIPALCQLSCLIFGFIRMKEDKANRIHYRNTTYKRLSTVDMYLDYFDPVVFQPDHIPTTSLINEQYAKHIQTQRTTMETDKANSIKSSNVDRFSSQNTF